MAAAEQDLRLQMLNTFLTTPHRQLDQNWPVHDELAKKDPRFYVRLAAWYNDHGDVRDHKELFAVALILSDFAGHRDVGLALLREMPPYQVARVVDFLHGRKRSRRVLAPDQPKLTLSREQKNELKEMSRTKRRLRLKEIAGDKRVYTTVVEDFGLFRNPPRSLRTEVARYLREREADPEWFDSTVLIARKALKRLYGLLHVKPGERAQKILFDEDPPADSRLTALRDLARSDSPAAQAEAVVRHKIPYRIAATVLKKVTPATLEALIERMSAQELINNLGAMKRHGVMRDPNLKALVDLKLEAAQMGPRVSALKADRALQATELSADVREKLETVADTQVKAKGRITRPVALLVDKSGSMEQAIEMGKRVGALISAVCEADLFVYAFDTIAYPIEPTGPKLADWERTFAGIKAGGMTSCGVAVEMLRRRRQRVEQIILVTDEEENEPPYFVESLQRYKAELGPAVTVCFVKTSDASSKLEEQCRKAGIKADVFKFSGDYYALPNLIPLIAPASEMDLLMEILDYPLPERKPG
jgi:hypothetical protein